MAVTVTIERMDKGPRLILENADQLAILFFTRDASSVGKDPFDAHAGVGALDSITDDDVRAINATMGARSPHEAWRPLTDAASLDFLQALDIGVDLLAMTDHEWDIGPYRNLAVATKILHLKRPGLFPVLDSLVVDQLGGSGRDPIDMVSHVRQQGLANIAALSAIQMQLAGLTVQNGPILRTRVRILDGLLWTSHPRTNLSPEVLHGWERIVRPGRGDL
jgi:hypothetical protein